MQMSGAQILIESLISEGVQTVFGYPGGQALNIFDEFYKAADRIKVVLTAHEQGAAHAADGYARTSGRPGVCVATSGPGATNLVTGIANAYLDSVPIVALTGNVGTPLLGRDSFQEVDIVGITQPIVKHNFQVKDVADLEATVHEAFQIAMSGRRGPVLIDIPKDVQINRCDYRSMSPLPLPTAPTPAPEGLAAAVAAIQASQRPFIYAGGGVLAAQAGPELLELSQRLAAPIGLSMMGLAAIPHSYPLNLGMCGMHGRYASTVTQSEADLVIGVGVRFSDRATGNVNNYTNQCKVIHIDIDAAELGKNVCPLIELNGDAKAILTELLKLLPAAEHPEWIARVQELEQREQAQTALQPGFHPQNIILAVHEVFGDDMMVVTDVGQHQMWVAQTYPFEKTNTLLTSGGLGTMGYGLGAANGCSMAQGRKRTVLFTSDGSFGMNLIELATAVSQQLPLVIVLLNNGVLGMVRQWQKRFYEEHYAQTTLDRKTDFTAVAKAFGARGVHANTLDELQSILHGELPTDGPILIECRIATDEQVLPMIPPGGSVKDILLS
ncbi:MAG: biosynthetic-type acetolactate synthase large subunit [Actinomycetia bacterium]|nr:biosynthetic-type acetolactate synthase large subunit [Actinomycetes bacterium]